MGFGHRIYKNYDPRARLVQQLAEEVFAVTGRNPLIDVALALEKVALSDEYFIQRRLYPNIDFYSGIIYQAMGFPMDMFPVLFADPPDVRVARPVDRDGPGPGAEDRPAPSDLHRTPRAASRRLGSEDARPQTGPNDRYAAKTRGVVRA